MSHDHLRRSVGRPLPAAALCAVLLGAASPAAAVTFKFLDDPFAGTGFDPIDGVRQVSAGTAGFGARLLVDAFDFGRDRLIFRPEAFGIARDLVFQNAPVGGFVGSGPSQPNFVVLQTTDDDGDPGTPFGAGNAANLIAGALGDRAPGFFIYHNSGLSLNRLVHSTDLSDPTADLAILAAFATPTGADGIAALEAFRSGNVAPIPVPGAAPLLAVALGFLGLFARSSRRSR